MKKLSIFIFVLLFILLAGCSNRRTNVGVGVGFVFHINPDPETKRRQALSTWYTSSSTLSSTYDKEEFISSITIDFIRNYYAQIAEESAKGQGKHLDALAQLIGKSPHHYTQFALALHKNYKNLFHPSGGVSLAEHPTQLLKIIQSPSFTNL